MRAIAGRWDSYRPEESAYSEFHYGPDRSRYLHIRDREEDGQLETTTIHYVGSLYERHEQGTGFTDKHYIRVDGQAVATKIYRSNADLP